MGLAMYLINQILNTLEVVGLYPADIGSFYPHKKYCLYFDACRRLFINHIQRPSFSPKNQLWPIEKES